MFLFVFDVVTVLTSRRLALLIVLLLLYWSRFTIMVVVRLFVSFYSTLLWKLLDSVMRCHVPCMGQNLTFCFASKWFYFLVLYSVGFSLSYSRCPILSLYSHGVRLSSIHWLLQIFMLVNAGLVQLRVPLVLFPVRSFGVSFGRLHLVSDNIPVFDVAVSLSLFLPCLCSFDLFSRPLRAFLWFLLAL